MSEPDNGVWRVANLTPFEVANEPQGARIVFAELDNIVRQARHAE